MDNLPSMASQARASHPCLPRYTENNEGAATQSNLTLTRFSENDSNKLLPMTL